MPPCTGVAGFMAYLPALSRELYLRELWRAGVWDFLGVLVERAGARVLVDYREESRFSEAERRSAEEIRERVREEIGRMKDE